MSSCIGRYSFFSYIAFAMVNFHLSQNTSFAQVYFTGPYGPGGTWNLYEHRGFLGSERVPGAGEWRNWTAAHEDAISRVEPVSGTNARGHLLALSGPTAQQENDFVADWVGRYGAWIGLTDNEAFGGGEAGTNGLAGFGNPPGDGVGWKWTSGEVFDFANWSAGQPREEDGVAISGGGRTWFDYYQSSEVFPYVVEYETRSPTPLNLPPAPQPPLLPGPAARPGAFGVREVAGNGPLQVLGDAVRSLQNIGAGALVRDYHAPLIDYQAEVGFRFFETGPSGPFELLRRGDVAYNELDDFAMVAHGQILIPEGQGGDWTFGVNSDDGFELYIPGAQFDPASATVTHYGSFMVRGQKGADSFPVVAHVTLQPGIHDIELVYFEHAIDSSVELSAAPGRRTQTYNAFALIGAPAQNVVGRTPGVTGGYQLTNVQRIPNVPGDPPLAEQITSIAQAKQLLDAPDANDLVGNSQAAVVNHDNITPGRHGRYSTDLADLAFQFPGNDFASIARSTLSVATGGTYTFGFAVLDGGELTIDGAQFRETFGEGLITNGGESLTLDRVTDEGIAFASVDLAAGTYPLEFVTYNRDREALAELFVAPGRVDFFDTGAFMLLSGARSIRYIRPAGLQLVPEPATVLLATIGGMIAGLVMWRRSAGRFSFVLLIALAILNFDLGQNAAFAQVYFTGPYGPGGTWNLYEHRGFLGSERVPGAGEWRNWTAAHEDAISRVEPVSGTNARGHLLALSGPTAQQENDFVADRVGRYGAWIGLTDNEAFGGGEAGTNGMAGFGNPPGDGVGWKWTNGEVFDFANWGAGQPREEDGVAISPVSGMWVDSYHQSPERVSPYVVEYETRSPTPLNLPPASRAPLLPGPAAPPGAFGIREVAGNGQVIFLNDAVRSLQNIGPGALVRDYHASLIDFQAEFGFRYSTTGPNSPFELLRRGDIAFHQLDHFAMVAHGQILIPEGQGGEWTFGVNSDDGFELYIPGAPFDHSNNTVTHYGSFVFQGGRGAGTYPDVAHVTLQPGIHDIELVYFERDGYSSVELSAAPGRRPQHYTSFALVGAPAQNVVGRTPTVTGGYQFTSVQRIPNMPGDPPPAEQITSIAQAKQLLNSPDANDRVGNSQATIVNHDSITTIEAGLPHGRYILDQEFQFPGNDFVSLATSTLSVATAGTYTFGFAVLDGGELTIDGAQFREAFGEGLITNGGESLTLDRVTDEGIAFASVDLAAGTYPLEFVTYNRDREALAELFVAPGRVDFFDTGAFALLSETSTFIRHVRPAGLQLVPEPATVLLATIGGMIASLVVWRRYSRCARTAS